MWPTTAAGVVDGFAKDPFDIARARRLTTTGALDAQGLPADWDSGQFTFDPSGNVAAMGFDAFSYDTVNRLSAAAMHTEGDTHALQWTYDSFGNATSQAHQLNSEPSETTVIPSSTASNRLSGVDYDQEGQQTEYGLTEGAVTWDPFGRIAHRALAADGNSWFGYDVAGERIVTLGQTRGTYSVGYSVRDTMGRPLRTFRYNSMAGSWGWDHDELFLGRLAFASDWVPGSPPNTFVHHHRDHLGSLRLLTDQSRTVVSELRLFPYGDPLDGWANEPLQFTGHERDQIDSMGGLDYMHARYYTAHFKRFLSPDPVGGDPASPQSWNRYGYVLNNPVLFVDPFGLL